MPILETYCVVICGLYPNNLKMGTSSNKKADDKVEELAHFVFEGSELCKGKVNCWCT